MNEQENKNIPSTGIEIDLEKDGPEIAGGQTDFASAERIMMRQRGTRIHPGQNVGIGKDDTLFAKAERVTGFERSGKDSGVR